MEALDIHPSTPLDDLLRRAVGAWRERHGMSARRFGAEDLGDPGFVSAQARGRSVRLGTVNRVLVFMGLAPLGPAFLREVEAFLAVTGAPRLRSWANWLRATGRWWGGSAGELRPASGRSTGFGPGWPPMRARRRRPPSAPGSMTGAIPWRPRGPESTWKRKEGEE